MPDPYILMLFVVGALVALVAWLPLVFRRAPFSLPIVCVGLGAALFSLPQVGFDPLPQVVGISGVSPVHRTERSAAAATPISNRSPCKR